MSRTLVKKKSRTIILGSLSGNPWGDVVGVFPEDQRSKYSKTNDSGACEDFGRGTDEVRRVRRVGRVRRVRRGIIFRLWLVDSCQMDGLARTGAHGILRTTTKAALRTGVSRTLVKKKIPDDFFGSSIKTPVSPLETLGGM